VLTPAATAEALCIYKGVNNARTTIRQEYADASWVVRARVLSATNGVVEAGKLDAGSPWTLYHLQVVHSYKGKPPQRIAFFTMRNSGGFYMDRPWVPLPRGHDLGGEYLLFLNPVAPYRGQPGLSAERPSSLTTAASLDRGVKFRPGRADCWHHSQLDAECPFSTHCGRWQGAAGSTLRSWALQQKDGTMTNPLTMKLEQFTSFAPEERQRLDQLLSYPTQTYPRGRTIIREREKVDDIHLVLTGLAARSKTLRSGERQFMALLVPRDLCDVEVFVLEGNGPRHHRFDRNDMRAHPGQGDRGAADRVDEAHQSAVVEHYDRLSGSARVDRRPWKPGFYRADRAPHV
jgi:hypothetical protein